MLSMSKLSIILSIIFIILTNFFYFPRWAKSGKEATLSWDVSGYYMYLPAFFIYKDSKGCGFKDEILSKYGPTPDFQQAFLHEKSGNHVMKYSIGQAVVFSPFFFVAHAWASNDARYPADGFSFPYQFIISMGSLLIAILGLVFLRNALLHYFNDMAAGLSVLGIVLGSNYLNYSAIDGAMTHNTLFTLYAFLLYLSITFYENPSLLKSAGIGLLVGLGALIRPTEIISFLIPVLWGVNLLKAEEIKNRLSFFKQNGRLLLLAVLVCLLTGSIQFIYWKYVSGDWIVYSYQKQGFSWLNPHIMECLFSYKSGWLIYSPFMLFALLGFMPLFLKKKSIFFALALFSLLFMYIAFAWDIWWYGGSLGQRAMVQAYPVLAFPLAAFIAAVMRSKLIIKLSVLLPALLFVYANLWFTHQAHKGGLMHISQMTRAYYWKTLFTYEKNPEHLKLLDDVEGIFEGEPADKQQVFQDTSFFVVLDQNQQFSPLRAISSEDFPSFYDWIRVSADFSIRQKERRYWTMTQFIVELKNGTQQISRNVIRVQRQLAPGESRAIYLDIPKPDQPFSTVTILFWNAKGDKEIRISDLKVEVFREG